VADYTLTGYHDLASNGTNLVPETWIPKWAQLLASNSCWSPFVTGEIDGARLLAAGMGDTIRCNYMGAVNIPTADNTAGTYTAKGTQSSYQASLTVTEYSHMIEISGDEMFKIANGIESFAMDSMMLNALQAWEYRIGAKAITAAYNFDCRSETSLVQSAAAGGTVGTGYMLPYHVRNMVAWNHRHNVPGFTGQPYEYVIMGPAGMFGAITAQTEFTTIAAMQNPGFYASGALGVYNRCLCVEETGVTTLTHSTTTGTGIIMGPAILGDTTVKVPSSFHMWGDTRDVPGRLSLIGWLGHYALGLVPDLGTIARIHTIHAKCE